MENCRAAKAAIGASCSAPEKSAMIQSDAGSKGIVQAG
jgi:hypothetical protein